MYQQNNNVYGYGPPSNSESAENNQQPYGELYSRQPSNVVNFPRAIDTQEKPNNNNSFTNDLLSGLAQTAMNYNNNDDVERMIHHTSNTELPALPPLNVASPSSRHQEKWLSEQEKLRSANLMSQQQQPDQSVLIQYKKSRDDRGLMSPYSPTQQSLSQQQQIFAGGGEIGHYGCGVMGCFATFAGSSALFYHIKNDHANMELDKPYRCAMPSCSKRYKNINGLQYHLRDAKGSSGHGKGDQEANTKAFQCPVPGCKKAYRTQNGLRSHQQRGHNIQQPTMMNSSMHLPPHLMESIQQQQQVMNQQHLQQIHQQQQQFPPPQQRNNW